MYSHLTKNPAKELAAGDHEICLKTTKRYCSSFRGFRQKAEQMSRATGISLPFMPDAITYPRGAVQKLISSKSCTGLRIYPAIKRKRQLTMIMVAVDREGNSILPVAGKQILPGTKSDHRVVDEGQMSPPYPATRL